MGDGAALHVCIYFSKVKDVGSGDDERTDDVVVTEADVRSGHCRQALPAQEAAGGILTMSRAWMKPRRSLLSGKDGREEQKTQLA